MRTNYGWSRKRERTVWILMLLPGLSFCIAGYYRLPTELQEYSARVLSALLATVSPW